MTEFGILQLSPRKFAVVRIEPAAPNGYLLAGDTSVHDLDILYTSSGRDGCVGYIHASQTIAAKATAALS